MVIHASMSLEIPYKLYKADNGGLKFTLIRNLNLFEHNYQPALHLIAKNCPHTELYGIKFDHEQRNLYITTGQHIVTTLPLPDEFYDLEVSRFDLWMTWHDQEICLGLVNHKPYFVYPRIITGGDSAKEFIGYIKFETNYGFEWKVEESPQVYHSISSQDSIHGGELRWVALENHQVPVDAFIGGFEKNPLYIARAMYSGSLCPGKYDPEKRKAFVAWGGREHEKNNFQILCGYNARWIKCKDNNIPENAFVAGTSEVRNEPLYIGRAMINHNLIVGKVHTLYKTCYLPYEGEEIERHEYEILIDLNKKPKGIFCIDNCKLNAYNKDQMCSP